VLRVPDAEAGSLKCEAVNAAGSHGWLINTSLK